MDEGELAIDRRVLVHATLIATAFLIAVAAVNALTLTTDAARSGIAQDWRDPWILEYTSIATTIALVPLIALWERRFPVRPYGLASWIAAHVVGSIAFSALHVAGMTVLRKLVFGALGRPYTFLNNPLIDLIYEYRKDILTYAIALVVITILRGLEEQRRDAATARAEAERTGRITLKSGGRTTMLDAASIEWAKAAGNYVELRANGRTHLVRTTLTELEEQLGDAGAQAARVHRSLVVNKAKVVEIVPLGDGDVRILTKDGSELRGSRRYRERLEA